MPFVLRQVEPINLVRNKEKKDDGGDIAVLADCENRLLVNLIEQITNLSSHAANIMEEIGGICDGLNQRSATLQNRVIEVEIHIEKQQGGATAQPIMEDGGFRESRPDEMLFTNSHRPKAVASLYKNAGPLPAIAEWQYLREDEKIGEKFYSNPDYFFELWKEAFLENLEKEKKAAKQRRKERKKKTGDKKPQRKQVEYVKIETSAEKARKKMIEEGKIVANAPGLSIQQTQDYKKIIDAWLNNVKPTKEEDFRNMLMLTINKRFNVDKKNTTPAAASEGPRSRAQTGYDMGAPPPPPSIGEATATIAEQQKPQEIQENLQQVPEPMETVPETVFPTSPFPDFPEMPPTPEGPRSRAQTGLGAPPPPPVPVVAGPPPPPPPAGFLPPPPPPPGGLPPPPPAPGAPGAPPAPPPGLPPPSSAFKAPLSLADQLAGAQLRKATPVEAPKTVDTRSGLLDQIKAGRMLKKVDRGTVQASKNRPLSGMGGVMERALNERRGAFDSEDEDDESDDDDWDDSDYE